NLDCLSRAPTIKTKLKTTCKGSNTKNQKPPTEQLIFFLQSFLGKVNFLRRFISNLAGKIRPLSPLLKLKDAEQFIWGTEHQAAFDDIKKYLSQPPVLMPPKRGKPLRLYISASESSIGCLLAQNNEFE
ncbi:unnamed protein product, partial [Prunus brigantina]